MRKLRGDNLERAREWYPIIKQRLEMLERDGVVIPSRTKLLLEKRLTQGVALDDMVECFGVSRGRLYQIEKQSLRLLGAFVGHAAIMNALYAEDDPENPWRFTLPDLVALLDARVAHKDAMLIAADRTIARLEAQLAYETKRLAPMEILVTHVSTEFSKGQLERLAKVRATYDVLPTRACNCITNEFGCKATLAHMAALDKKSRLKVPNWGKKSDRQFCEVVNHVLLSGSEA